jgi:hypothetical protein
MLVRPDSKEFQCLARMVQSPDGEVFMQLLDSELQRLTAALLDASGEQLLRVQGATKEVKELSSLLRNSPELAQKTRST